MYMISDYPIERQLQIRSYLDHLAESFRSEADADAVRVVLSVESLAGEDLAADSTQVQ